MIRLSNIKADLDIGLEGLKEIAAIKTGLDPERIIGVKIAKRAVDARNKSHVHFVYSLDIEVDGDEEYIASILAWKDAEIVHDEIFCKPQAKSVSDVRPVVVGSGPGGMLAGLVLAEAGLKPIILERGKPVNERIADVDLFWKTGHLKPESNVQFGEGGAGTFSDGKLMTGIKKDRYVRKVMEELVAAGAPEDILYLAKPHIGTDRLALIVPKIREKIISLGGEYRFENRLKNLVVKDGKLQGIKIEKSGGEIYEMPCEKLILAIGHSARDTFEMLNEAGVVMEAKPFAVGVRIEHSQEMINKAQYGNYAGNPHLGAADYKLAVHLPNGRSAYTFCMCPGGEVVAAASETGRVATNGMSRYARNEKNANSALLVGITPDDFTDKHPLGGMYFQRKIEEAAFRAGGENYYAPAQMVGDFLKKQVSQSWGNVEPSYKPGVKAANLDEIFPPYITETLRAALPEMGRKLRGFDVYDAVLTGPETRSSSPVRILRGENLESLSLKGLYPCGEGAGYAGGIVSAAADGVKIAEQLVRAL